MLGTIVIYQRIVDSVCVGMQTENIVEVGGTLKENSKRKQQKENKKQNIEGTIRRALETA